MAKGRVKWFSDEKGYGFIRPDEGGKDLFFHYSALQMEGFRTIEEKARVEYELEQTPKGLQAKSVRLVEE